MTKKTSGDQRKFKVYNSLRMVLGRSKISKPGYVATLLLEVFFRTEWLFKSRHGRRKRYL